MTQFLSRARVFGAAILGVALLTGCQPDRAGDIVSPQRVKALQSVLEAKRSCTLPLTQAYATFTQAGFTSGQERVEILWKLRTDESKVAIANGYVTVTTRRCGHEPDYFLASRARFDVVQGFFLGQPCQIPIRLIPQYFHVREMGLEEVNSYLDILFAAGVLTRATPNVLQKTGWDGCL